MSIYAAVMTGRGAGAIATIQLFGGAAEAVVRAIVRRRDGGAFEFVEGRILLGDVVDGELVLDQVTVGCEGPDLSTLHCHGNPLIVERIMALLQRHGVQPVQAQELCARVLTNREPKDAIGAEVELALMTVKTIEGACLIANQVEKGLAAKARQWQIDLDSMPAERIAAEARQVQKDSDTAKLILSGCTIALIGPPNVGKSTLLNALAGREKAIVTDIRGTTRDWVSAEIRIPPLIATFVDTAGLDLSLAAGQIDQAAQHKTAEAVNRADVVLLVLDASEPFDLLSPLLAEMLVGRKVITVLNKIDIATRPEQSCLLEHPGPVVRISAKRETGIADLIRAILRTCDLADFPLDAAVTFTDRQRILLHRVVDTESHDAMAGILAELLHVVVA